MPEEAKDITPEEMALELQEELEKEEKKGEMEGTAEKKSPEKTLAETLGIAPQGKKDEKTEKPYGRII